MSLFDLFSLKKNKNEEVKTYKEKAPLSPGIYGLGGAFGSGQVRTADLLPLTKGYQIFKEMGNDDQIKAALNLKKLAILSAGYEILPASEADKDKEIADFLYFVFDQMEGSIEQSLLDILSALDFGYSITEKVFEMTKKEPFPGKVILRFLKSKNPADFEFEVDQFGNVLPEGLVQQSTGKRFPIKKFIRYTYDSKFHNVYGKSDLRAAYRSYFSKKEILKGYNQYVERFGVPIPVGLTNPSMQPAQQSILKNILDTLQFKTSIILPKQLVEELEVVETNGTGSEIFNKAISYHDRAIVRSLLLPDQLGLGGHEGGGSLAKAKQQFDVFMMVISHVQQEISEHVVKEQIFRPLVELNFGRQRTYPTFRFRRPDPDNKQKIAQLWINAVKDGIVGHDLTDENVFRTLLNFPEKEEEDIDAEGYPDTPEESDKDIGGNPSNLPDQNEGKGGLQTLCSKHVHRYTRARLLHKFERKINFQEIETGILAHEKKTLEEVSRKLILQKNNLRKSISRKLTKNEVIPSLIRNLKLPNQNDVRKAIKDNFLETYKAFRSAASKEIAQLKKMAIVTGEPILPQYAINYLTNKAFVVSGTINDQLTSKVKFQLLQGLKEGLTTKEIIKNIDEIWIPFIGDPLTADNINTPFRLETIVRTNLNEAYNQGRKDAFKDSVNEGFIIGYFYSAIIDGRQTAICDFLDEKILPVNDPRTDKLIPPNHFNERSTIVPVTRDEAPVVFISEADFNKALTLRAETGF